MFRTSHLRHARCALVLVAGVALSGLAPHSTRAEDPPVTAGAVFSVDTVAEGADDWPGNGICFSTLARGCSLRAAVLEANYLPGDDTIALPAGTYVLSTTGAGEDVSVTGDLDILSNISITGAGKADTIVDGNASDSVLEVHPGVMARIAGITIRNGSGSGYPGGVGNAGTLTILDSLVTANAAAGNGGGIGNYSGATLVLNGSQVLSNRTTLNGGGIFNAGTLTLNDSKVQSNQAALEGGGLDNNTGVATLNRSVVADNVSSGSGGGIYSDASLALVESRVERNRTTADPSYGGGVYNVGTAVVARSALLENEAQSEGGNFYSRRSLTLTDSQVSGGWARLGGGIANGWNATLVNVTISGNRASLGGGIYNHTGAGDTINIVNATFAGNTAVAMVGGAIYNTAGSATLKNTIVANSAAGADCFGTLLSAGHNLDSGATCAFGAAGDRSNVDPRLGPLEENGNRAPGLTYALLAGSPAIEAGDASGCPDTDQRGTRRPLDGNLDRNAVCDIGAYEYDALPNKQFLPGAQR